MLERHTQNAIESAVVPMIETMEERRMLSASVVDGALIVSGTSGDDVITFSLNAEGTKVKVKINGDVDGFRVDQVLRISANGKAGHDRIKMNNNNGVLEFKTRMRGGEGNDTLLGGEMRDRLYGGAGNDLLRGGGGDDDLQGEDGDDNCQGDQGNDVLNGGQGEDELWGGDGDDQGEDEDGDSVLDEDDQGEDGGGNQQ